MRNREFSDTAKQIAAVKSRNGYDHEIRCVVCRKRIPSMDQCIFAPIVPFERGGEPTEDNCQVLCADCSQNKARQDLANFLRERKHVLAKDAAPKPGEAPTPDKELTKEEFDQIITDFVSRNHTIRRIDFVRIGTTLPSLDYVSKYYGNFATLKSVFESRNQPIAWNRDTIKTALEQYAKEHGNFGIPDLTNQNRLPSLKSIMRFYPEYKTLAEFKQEVLGLGKVRRRDSYQNDYVSEEDIKIAVDNYFGDRERIVGSTNEFLESFPYSSSTLLKRFGSIAVFYKKHNITVKRTRVPRYTKQDVDDAILKWVQEGKEMPEASELTKCGLPCKGVILRYYKHVEDPFVLFQRAQDETNP